MLIPTFYEVRHPVRSRVFKSAKFVVPLPLLKTSRTLTVLSGNGITRHPEMFPTEKAG